jgi:superfamily I DNA/RNA helicase
MTMHLPTWDELDDDQRNILDYDVDQSLFAVGPPGSGKTVLALGRAKMLADSGRSVALVTYNRMLRRLANLLNKSKAITQTMHSFVWRDFCGRTGEEPPREPSDPYLYAWSTMLDKLHGHRSSRPMLDHLVIDEGQDLPEAFFRYAHRHVARTLTVFADEDQAVGGRWTTLEEMRDAANLGNPIMLQENYRNTPDVAMVAEHFHRGRLPAARPRRSSIREIPRLFRSVNMTESAQRIANWFQNRRGTIGVVVRRNGTGTQIHAELSNLLPGRRVDIYKSGETDEDSIDLLKDGVTVLNKESVKGQEFDTVFVLELEDFVPCLNDPMHRAMYMLCARARDHLWLVHGPGNLSPQAEASLPLHLLQRVV